MILNSKDGGQNIVVDVPLTAVDTLTGHSGSISAHRSEVGHSASVVLEPKGANLSVADAGGGHFQCVRGWGWQCEKKASNRDWIRKRCSVEV